MNLAIAVDLIKGVFKVAAANRCYQIVRRQRLTQPARTRRAACEPALRRWVFTCA